MNDLIERITNAIFRMEGMPPDYFNPGNLRSAPWLVNPTIEHGFWKPASRAAGIAGAAHCVALRISMGQNLMQLIAAWAPPSDGNNTTRYIANVALWAEIPSATEPLWNFIETIPT